MIKIIELMAFAVSAAAFTYGAFYLFRREVPKYFRLYVCAAGCYMLEELWVIVNALFGNGGQDGLVTVRLFGFFGCLLFMLSANANEFDRVVDEGTEARPRRLGLLAPAVLLGLYSLYAFSPANPNSRTSVVIGLLSISPALFASYFSLKHLLLPDDPMGFLNVTEDIDILTLFFYAANYLYPFADLCCPRLFMSVCDVLITLLLFAIVICCRKGASRWGTLT